VQHKQWWKQEILKLKGITGKKEGKNVGGRLTTRKDNWRVLGIRDLYLIFFFSFFR